MNGPDRPLRRSFLKSLAALPLLGGLVRPILAPAKADFRGCVDPAGPESELPGGVEVECATWEWTETHRIDSPRVGDDYRRGLFALTGRTNAAPFRGFLAGECLFLGATGAPASSDDPDWLVTYRFRALPPSGRASHSTGDFAALGLPRPCDGCGAPGVHFHVDPIKAARFPQGSAQWWATADLAYCNDCIARRGVLLRGLPGRTPTLTPDGWRLD